VRDVEVVGEGVEGLLGDHIWRVWYCVRVCVCVIERVYVRNTHSVCCVGGLLCDRISCVLYFVCRFLCECECVCSCAHV